MNLAFRPGIITITIGAVDAFQIGLLPNVDRGSEGLIPVLSRDPVAVQGGKDEVLSTVRIEIFGHVDMWNLV